MPKMSVEECVKVLNLMKMDMCSILDDKSKEDFFTKQARERYEALSIAQDTLQQQEALVKFITEIEVRTRKDGDMADRAVNELAQQILTPFQKKP